MDSLTATTTQELSVPLRAWPTSKPGQDSLLFLITRINEQKKSFRDVSEHGLVEEIQALEAGEGETHEEETSVKEEHSDSKTRKEEMLTARVEIITQVGYGAFYTEFIEFIDADLKKAGSNGELIWLGFRFVAALQVYSQTS